MPPCGVVSRRHAPMPGTALRSSVPRKSSWRIEAMWKDEVVEEVREVRRAHAAAHGHDLRQIFADLKRKEEASGRPVVTLPPRPARFQRAATALQPPMTR